MAFQLALDDREPAVEVVEAMLDPLRQLGQAGQEVGHQLGMSQILRGG